MEKINFKSKSLADLSKVELLQNTYSSSYYIYILTEVDMFFIITYRPAGSTSQIWMHPAALELTDLDCSSTRAFLVAVCSACWVRERRFSPRGVGVRFNLK